MSTAWLEVAPTWAKLQTFHVFVEGVNAVAPVAEGVRSGNRASLAQVAGTLTRLAATGELGRQLEAGTITLERWTSIANVQGSTLNGILRTLSEEEYFARFWDEVVITTAEDGSTIIRQGAAGFGFGAGAVLALLVALWALRAFR